MKKEKPSMRQSVVHILSLFNGPCQAVYMLMLILYKQEGRFLATTENVTASQLYTLLALSLQGIKLDFSTRVALASCISNILKQKCS